MALPFLGEARVPGAVGTFPGDVSGRLPGPIGLRLDQSTTEASPFHSSIPRYILGVLHGMDDAGEEILGTYLNGGGIDHAVRDDPMWTPYMMNHKVLAGQILIQLRDAVTKIAAKKQLGRFSISVRFHAEFPENNDFSGYALLHGSNKNVGDFLLAGFADVHEANEPAEGAYDIDLDLQFVFNDMIDPNGNYWTDSVRSFVANIITFGKAANYRLSIGWGSKCLAEVRPGRDIYFEGYPSSIPISIRPLPVGKLDWVGDNRKYAKEIEDKIIEQLKRNIAADDTRSQAERKQRLLWLFYKLGYSYFGSTYRDRMANPPAGDELARLLRERLSPALAAECLAALRGKRPEGVEPPSASLGL